jgi:hypothetical protein
MVCFLGKEMGKWTPTCMWPAKQIRSHRDGRREIVLWGNGFLAILKVEREWVFAIYYDDYQSTDSMDFQKTHFWPT